MHRVKAGRAGRGVHAEWGPPNMCAGVPRTRGDHAWYHVAVDVENVEAMGASLDTVMPDLTKAFDHVATQLHHIMPDDGAPIECLRAIPGL